MYLWNTEFLATDIKNGNVSEREWKNYYLAISVFFTLALYLAVLIPTGSVISVLVEAIAMVGVLIFGVSITYQSNKGDNGVDYIPRMTALSLPITIKLLLLSVLFGFLVGIVDEAASFSEAAFDWLMTGFVVAMEALFFWRLNVHVKRING